MTRPGHKHCSPLHPYPGEHAIQHRIFIEPVSFATVGVSQVVDDMLVGDVVEFLRGLD